MLGQVRFLQTISWAFLVGAALGSTLFVSATLQSRQSNVGNAGVDVTKLGPQVGEKVPDFSLSDQRGQIRTLASLMGPKGLVLVFNRSADW